MSRARSPVESAPYPCAAAWRPRRSTSLEARWRSRSGLTATGQSGPRSSSSPRACCCVRSQRTRCWSSTVSSSSTRSLRPTTSAILGVHVHGSYEWPQSCHGGHPGPYHLSLTPFSTRLQVHERHLTGDFLLGILLDIVRRRATLKVVLMSATIQQQLFADYFGAFPIQASLPGAGTCSIAIAR